MTSKPYPYGIDCVWLALDADDRVGAFVSAGVGPIPARALSCEYGAVEEIEEHLMHLPCISTARLLIANDVPSFVALAAHGLFVYDWQDAHRSSRDITRTYEPVAAPVNPINAGHLPERLLGFARCVIFDDFRFVDRQALDVASLMSCRDGE